VELDETLAASARQRFRRSPSVEVCTGDSAVLMPEIVDRLDGSTLYWLDGHYSGGVTADAGRCPIVEELTAILGSRSPFVALVDDARLFDGTDGYPTLASLLKLVADAGSDLHATVANDMVVITR
jgi:hypothetical protein